MSNKGQKIIFRTSHHPHWCVDGHIAIPDLCEFRLTAVVDHEVHMGAGVGQGNY